MAVIALIACDATVAARDGRFKVAGSAANAGSQLQRRGGLIHPALQGEGVVLNWGKAHAKAADTQKSSIWSRIKRRSMALYSEVPSWITSDADSYMPYIIMAR